MNPDGVLCSQAYPRSCYIKICFEKFRKIHRKTLAMRSFFVVKLQTEVCFPMGITRVIRTAILHPANIYLFKATTGTLVKGVKYVQS